MASDSEIQDQDRASFKCRRCRQFLFSSASILPSLTADAESARPGNPGNTAPKPGQEQPRAAGALWYISDDAVPPWIQSAIEEAQWTKGKLTCPKCRGRLGSFDFLTPSIRHCADRRQAWSCVQINGSRVDRETSKSLLAFLRRGNQSQVKGQASQMSSLEAESVACNTDRFEDQNGALPVGCWYLNRDEMDTKQLSHTPTNFDPNFCPNESGHKDTLNPFEMDNLGSPEETTKASNLEPASKTSDSPCTPNVCDSFAVGEPSRVQENQAASRTLPCEGDVQSSEKLLGNSPARLEPGFGNLDHTGNIPCASCTNSVDETIQFGFSTAAKHSRTSCEVSNDAIWHDREADIVPGITAEKSEDVTMSKPSPSLQTNLSNSLSQVHQGLCNSHPTRPVQGAPKRPIKTQYSNADSQSEQTVVSALSPETWQGVLDELLLDLDQERGGASERTLSGRDDINQLEDEMDTDSDQDGMGHADDSWTAQTSSNDSSRGVSTYLQRAVQRAQRREKNKRKSARRKLRRRERWMAEKETEEQELLIEEQHLDCDPKRILALLGTSETSVSTREALTCPVCLDLYLNPHRCLPCQHVFCESCLRRLAHTAQTRVATPCPLCRRVIWEATPQDQLTTAIEELFPRLIAHRKQAERKNLNKSYPLPGHPAPTSLTSWISRTLAGNNRSGLRHWRGRGRQELTTVGLIRNTAWKVGSVLVLMISLIVLSAGFFLAMIKYS
ncbi:E3 ubiquitin-protein ligase RNF180-like [Patiria miniata]|uniref:RING-type domain-containing protein n=1 Tax=Patiria miniata TaxID=46514 RepID=A0A913Z1E4_PATMI|nr:E3 ubiquitin-protein ligase RNF180-like [Patiria miniata]